MVERVIEKTYKYMIPTPKELFQMFQEELSKAKLPDNWNASPQWTSVVLGIFYNIGRSLGYIPNKEYLRLDQTWEIRLPDISTIILALEYENTSRVEEILDDELQKLLDVKAFLKVLIFYPDIPMVMEEEKSAESTHPEIQDKIRSSKIKNPDERYIVVTLSLFPSMIEVTACSFDSEGKGEDLGDFHVNYTSKD